MKPAEIKKRISLIGSRSKNLWAMYPILTVAVVAVGFAAGFVVGKWL